MTAISTPFTFVHEPMRSATSRSSAITPSTRVRNYPCEVCSKIFKRSEHLLRHTRAHRREKLFECRYCVKSFTRKDLLTRHEKTIHVTEYREPEPTPRHVTRKRHQPISPNSSPTKSTHHEIGGGGGDEVSEIIVAVPAQTEHSPITSVTGPEYGGPPSVTGLEHGGRLSVTGSKHGGRPSVTGSQHGGRPSVTGSQHGGPQPSSSFPDAEQSPRNQKAAELPDLPSDGLIEDGAEKPQPIGLPLALDDLDLFNVFDDSIFAQMPFPLEIMDVDFSPQSHSIEGNTFSNTTADGPTAWSEDRMDFSVETEIAWDARLGAHDSAILGQPRSKSLQKPWKAKLATVDDSLRSRILTDLRESYRLDAEQLRQLPSCRMLENFLSRFFQCFQRHLPILHIPTFNISTCPTPLLVAICSIGALYTLNRKHAATLRVLANDALQASRARKYAGFHAQIEPIWQTQCNLLLSFGAMFGGSSSDTADAMSDLGCFVRPFTLRRIKLAAGVHETPVPTWEQWIEVESVVRLLCGIFIASSLNSVTYDVSPGFSGFRDLHFPLPAEEQLWEAQTEEEWRFRMQNCPRRVSSTVASILKQLVFSLDTELPSLPRSDIGAFATTIVMHGVNVHMYYLSQSSSILLNTCNGDEAFNKSLRLNQHSQTERTLSRCHEFLKVWQNTHDDHRRHEDSLIFNCQALLRLSYVRVFSGMQHFNRTTLFYEGGIDVEAAVQTYIAAPQVRNAFFTKAAEQVMFCFTAPIRAGHMLTRKTAAFTWSIEHAIACWECALFLSKWIYAVETEASGIPLNDDEGRILESLKEALQDAESPCDEARSLAAQVTKTWALFMDDVWVWEVTTRMGKVLRQLADAYATSWEAQRSNGF